MTKVGVNILGICNAKDSGAALIRDGAVIAAANEERFLRKKMVRTFPHESIEYVLSEGGIGLDGVKWIGCGAWRGIDQHVTLPRLVDDIAYIAAHSPEGALDIVQRRIESTIRSDAHARGEFEEGIRNLGGDPQRVIYSDHHLSHAACAFYASPFDEAFVLVADGRGDFRSVTLWVADRNSELRLIDFATELTSVGAMYGFVTKALGFIPDRHEGKVTGLAAHGRRTEAFDALKRGLFWDSEAGRIRSIIGPDYIPFASSSPEIFAELLQKYSRDDIAYAAQRLLESLLTAFLGKHLRDKAKASVNLCLAGGCAANVKLNFELGKLSQVRQLYVFPAMGDGGNALGGAICAAVAMTSCRYFKMPAVYLGPQYDDSSVMRAIGGRPLAVRRLSKREKIRETAGFLAEGKVVGWVQGRMEYGPRALGARSILCEAFHPSVNDKLNQRLHRSEFMPFAPVTIPEEAAKCFVGWREDDIPSQFMTVLFPCTAYLAEKCPAVVHVDGTARPQVISRNHNPDYYDVVEAYIKSSGRPALINTSFNLHEEPIINTPEEALTSLEVGAIDVLIINDFVITHPSGRFERGTTGEPAREPTTMLTS